MITDQSRGNKLASYPGNQSFSTDLSPDLARWADVEKARVLPGVGLANVEKLRCPTPVIHFNEVKFNII